MKPLYSLISVLLLIFLLSGSHSCKQEPIPNTASIIGDWQSVGYGRYAKIDSTQIVLYDITQISCLPMLVADVEELAENMGISNDTLYVEDGINIYYYTRVLTAPIVCADEISDSKKNDPEYNFEVLAETFKDHYAYFELRNVNWDTLYNKYRPRVTPSTSPPESYAIMEEMLDAFNDGHIYLSAPDSIEDAAGVFKSSTEEVQVGGDALAYSNHQVADAIADHYLKNKNSRRNKMVQWGILDDAVGYIQLKQMMGVADYGLADSLSGRDYWMAYFEAAELGSTEDRTKAELNGISSVMDEVMADFTDTKAVIIDVRFNGGGKDEVGLEVMRRFNAKDQIVFTKKARKGSGYTKPIPVELKSSTIPYTKPVYLLISPESASATEIMVLSSLLLEGVIRVGSNTEGVFSDVLDKTLPNGWEFGLSNEVYEDIGGNNYEGIGIPAEIEMNYARNKQKFLSKIIDELGENGDEAIEKALSLIRE